MRACRGGSRRTTGRGASGWRNGLGFDDFRHFNGTAGIWRRAAIEDCEGWQHDTLCEDLDLSYRALLRGWKPGYAVDVVVPAELSPQLQAFRQQQFRWAKGSTQCVKKLAPQVLESKTMPWWKKGFALVHISGYTIHVLFMLQVLLGPWAGLGLRPQDLGPLSALGATSALTFVFFYVLVLREIDPSGWRRTASRDFPVLMLLVVGICVNTCLALLEGWTGWGSNAFQRTPKFNVLHKGDRWKDSRYRLPISPTALVEVGLGLYSLAGAYLLYQAHCYFLVPQSCYFGLGFLSMACFSLQDLPGRRS